MKKCSSTLTAFLFILLLGFSLPQKEYVSNLTYREEFINDIHRVDTVNGNGDLTNDPAKGYASMIQALNSKGQPIEEYYLDEEGNEIACLGGYYRMKRIYKLDLCIQITYTDKAGNPICNTSGYSSIKRFCNTDGQITDIYYYDVEGKSVASIGGEYGEHREYDSFGRNYKTTFIGDEGQAVENSQGYAKTIREYYSDGKVDTIWYFGCDGNQVDIGSRRYGSRYIYENDKYVGWKPIDINGKNVFHFDEFLSENPWTVGVVAITLVVLCLFLNRSQRLVLLLAYTLFILYMTLILRASGNTNHNFELFWSYRQMFTDKVIALQILNNIWLFIPLGAMIASLKNSQRFLFLAVLFSVFIEAAQFIFGLGLCELDDIVSNSLGAWLGWGCFCEGMRLKNKGKASSV